MDSMNDPFPPSLPGLSSPQTLDSEMTTSLQDGDLEFFDAAYSQDSPDPLFAPDPSIAMPYQSPLSPKQNSEKPAHRLATTASSSASPESSVQDTSSEGSARRKRKTSSDSSHSDHGLDVQRGVDGAQAGPLKSENLSYDGENHHDTDFEYSNRAMENDFDFTTAASSPSPNVDSKPAAYTGPRHITIPYRESPGTTNRLLPPQASNSSTRDTSPSLAGVYPSQGFGHGHPIAPPSASQEEYINGTMLTNMEQLTTWPSGAQTTLNNYPRYVPPLAVQPHSLWPTGTPHGYPQQLPALPTLQIHPIPHKSRVETQIPIKLTLSPTIPGITKLHLPTHTVSKPKLLAKPAPTKSPDTLELSTMLVCTSAMRDPAKRQAALARASGVTMDSVQNAGRRSSTGDDKIPEESPNHPLNGGPVEICNGCITRERKRAARKKSKKPDEEEIWQKDEDKRIIVFNCTEVKVWQSPSTIDTSSTTNEAELGNHDYSGTIPLVPDNAMQVDLPMRVACYCRHQSEKHGFQVIFTIKDHQSNMIAQAMTDSIVITDDHKTHVPPLPPAPTSMFAEATPPGHGPIAREPLEAYGQPLFRNAHSTTDLQNLQHSFDPNFPQFGVRPFANPQNSSQTTSNTLTPRNLSRPASPSGPSGPTHKRRKASGSGKVPDGLTMTRLQTSHRPRPSSGTWTSTTSANATSSTAASPYSLGHHPFNSQIERDRGFAPTSTPGPYRTNPSTPNSAENTFFSNASRSQSLENFAAYQQMYSSAPSSARQSRVPSPVSSSQVDSNGVQVGGGHLDGQLINGSRLNGGHIHANAVPVNGFPQSHMVQQPPVSSQVGLPSFVDPQNPPRLHKVIPNQGSKAGGMEVTCLGSGFKPGLEVMFGDTLATTTTCWGDTSLVCMVPPANRAGTVLLTFKHQYHQHQEQRGRFPSPPLARQQVFFAYIDDDEQELIRHTLVLMHQRMTGTVAGAGEVARQIMGNMNGGPSISGQSQGNSPQDADQLRQMLTFNSQLDRRAGLESALLKCLELIDLGDSPHQVQINHPNANGQTILHWSASVGYDRLVAGLLVRGAYPDAQDRNGLSPMHMATLRGHPHIVRRLRLSGGDPELRSRRGFTPSDMALSSDVFNVVRALDRQPFRSRSTATASLAYRSQASSTASLRSLTHSPCTMTSFTSESLPSRSSDGETSDEEEEEDEEEDDGTSSMHAMAFATPAQLWARSRRNSFNREPDFMAKDAPDHLAGSFGLMAPAVTMAAWRDNLSTQIHQFQQNVNWTLPNLQIPTLPPMPNLPNYQGYPVVRRISSLVPQRNFRPSGNVDTCEAKETDHGWWDFLTGPAVAPPAYEEIYPSLEEGQVKEIDASLFDAAADAILEQKCAETLDHIQIADSLQQDLLVMGDQQRKIENGSIRKVSRVDNDRKLYFLWVCTLNIGIPRNGLISPVDSAINIRFGHDVKRSGL